VLSSIAIAAVGCSPAPQPPAESRDAPRCPSVVIAQVADAASAGKAVPRLGGGTVSVLDPPIVSTRDVAAARLGKAEGRDVIEIDLTEPAAARLRAYSETHVGKQLAFIIDDRVRKVLRLLDPIAGTGIIVDPADSNEASALLSSLGDGRCTSS